MTPINVLTTQEPTAWLRVLDACAPYDIYHLPEYHALAEEMEEGTAHLFSYAEGDHVIALPLLLRPVDGELLAAGDGTGWQDATSVYGYAGPVCSHRQVPAAVLHNFQAALLRKLCELRVVSVFSRLHPFFPQRALLAGLGDFALRQTVAIDLTLPPDVQRSRIRRSYRERISKLRRMRLSCARDQDGVFLDDFRRVYYETMRRVEAAERYFFPPSYFERLREFLGQRVEIFVCLKEGTVLCAALFFRCQGILQYHLGGTLNEAMPLAPMKLLLDEVCLWGIGQGLHTLHLGGGVTPHPDDSLLHFKKGFSDRTYEFASWRWVVFPEVYQQICQEKTRRNERHQVHAANPDFFPPYRCPTVTRAVPLTPAAVDPSFETTPGERP